MTPPHSEWQWSWLTLPTLPDRKGQKREIRLSRYFALRHAYIIFWNKLLIHWNNFSAHWVPINSALVTALVYQVTNSEVNSELIIAQNTGLKPCIFFQFLAMLLNLLWILIYYERYWTIFYPPKSLLIHLGKLRGLPVIHSNNAIPVKKSCIGPLKF